ncbi:MAG: hypothetical protein ABIE74_04230 [Pseudomonadota bacterium]
MKIKKYLVIAFALFLSSCSGGGSNTSPDPNGTTPDTTKWVQVVAGGHTCAITDAGELWCWGANDYGQVGIGSNTQNCNDDVCRYPNQVTSNTSSKSSTTNNDVKWASVSVGNEYTCGIKTDGTVWCWGNNRGGQLGNGKYGEGEKELSPIQVGIDNNWKSVACAYNSTYAIKTDGSVWTWGGKTFAQIGNDTDWVAVSTGNDAVFSKTNFTLWSVSSGSNSNCAFLTPCQINSSSDWRISATSFTNRFAIKSDGTLWDLTPKQIGADNDWALVQGYCSIKTDGTLWCWGNNDYGQFGNGSTSDQQVDNPVQVGTENSWAFITGGASNCGIKTDGTLWCWGYNFGGQLGIGTAGIDCDTDSTDYTCADEHSPRQVKITSTN